MAIINQSQSAFGYALPVGAPKEKVQKSNTVSSLVLPKLILGSVKGEMSFVEAGDKLKIMLKLNNTSELVLKNPTLSFTLSTGIAFEAASVIAGGKAAKDDISSVALNNMMPQEEQTVEFLVGAAFPCTEDVSTIDGTINFIYTDPIAGEKTAALKMERLEVTIVQGTIEIEKSVSTAYANTGEEIVYTCFIKNTGNVTASNLSFSDKIPEGTTFKEGSLKVNGETKAFSPQEPFALPDLNRNAQAKIEFTVIVE